MSKFISLILALSVVTLGMVGPVRANTTRIKDIVDIRRRAR